MLREDEGVKEQAAMIDLGFLAPHERLLVTLARRADVRPPLGGDGAQLEDRVARARLVRLAKEQGVHGLILSALVGPPPFLANVSAEVAREIGAAWTQLRRQAALWDMERDKLLSRLAAEGLTPVLLKGGALRAMVYREPAERSMGDLDLLLPPTQLEPARAVLERLGYKSGGTDATVEAYRRHHFHLPLAHPNGFVVEIHWALSRPAAGFHLDERAVLDRAFEWPRDGAIGLRVPSFEDMIVHLASQNQEDAFGRLRRLVDVDRIAAEAPDLDWAYVRDASRRGNVQMLLGLSLRLCELLLGTRMPEGFVESLELSRLSRLNLAMLRPIEWALREPAQRRAAAADAVLFWTTVRWGHRMRRLATRAWPKADPLAWMWQREARDRPLWRLAKLAGYQAWLGPRAALAMLTRSGRRHRRFWTDVAGQGRRAGKTVPRV